jgi:hypothetical protein
MAYVPYMCSKQPQGTQAGRKLRRQKNFYYYRQCGVTDTFLGPLLSSENHEYKK